LCGRFDIGKAHEKIEKSPVIATFMPSAAPGFDLFNEWSQTPPRTSEPARFLKDVQQQAIATDHDKIASITFPIPSITPWAALSALGKAHHRHVYYDSPQPWALVGLDVAVGYSGAGAARFDQAQQFIQSWRSQFVYAEPIAKTVFAGRFFCSATFFNQPSPQPSPQLYNQPANQSSAPSFEASDCAPFAPVYVFVPRVQVMTMDGASTVTFNCLMRADTDIEAMVNRVQAQILTLNATTSIGEARSASQKIVVKDVAAFEQTVAGALSQVSHSVDSLHKVVLADVMDVVAPQAVDVVRSLQTLRKNHPDCTVFSVGNGRGQSFIGASPERLLSINEGQLTTDALAGSASRGKTPNADRAIGQSLLDSEKERYEHRVVVDFIVRQLRSLNLIPHHAANPKLLQLLHIQHLHTPITATLDPAKISPLDILAKLHPTPAVAGLPREPACQLISQHETFDRSLYAAPLGWIDTRGNSEFIVGIRSALIDGCKARLYAGAGIVAGSEPAKELAEIRLKLQTLLNALV